MLTLRSIHQFVLTGLTSILFLGNVQAANLSISPDKGIEGTLAIINGSELPPNDRVDIEWSSAGLDSSFIGLVAENVLTDGNGNFTVAIVAPKGSSKTFSAIINVFKKGDLVLGSTSFTVTDKEPEKCCLDAYFIGTHGTAEGPDGPNQILSKVIGETWDHFYSLAQLNGKKVRGYAVDYPAPLVGVVEAFIPNVHKGRKALGEIISKIRESCDPPDDPKCFPNIVLTGYSLGAWVVNDWLTKGLDKTDGNWTLWHLIRAVELYGDPLWHREGNNYKNDPFAYSGLATGVANTHNPYSNNPLGPQVRTPPYLTLANRWQSRCLKGDPICGEGYVVPQGVEDIAKCLGSDCEHHKYTIANSGYNLTDRGANYLYYKALTPKTPHPEVIYHETFREGDLVFFRLFFKNPAREANGFGFVGIKGSGWAEENPSFDKPSYGRVHLNQWSVEYPFNHACVTGPAYESDVAAWINYTSLGVEYKSDPVPVHMTCQTAFNAQAGVFENAPCEVVTPYPKDKDGSSFTWDDMPSSPESCRAGIAR